MNPGICKLQAVTCDLNIPVSYFISKELIVAILNKNKIYRSHSSDAFFSLKLTPLFCCLLC